jgi:hypothetical protein
VDGLARESVITDAVLCFRYINGLILCGRGE